MTVRAPHRRELIRLVIYAVSGLIIGLIWLVPMDTGWKKQPTGGIGASVRQEATGLACWCITDSNRWARPDGTYDSASTFRIWTPGLVIAGVVTLIIGKQKNDIWSGIGEANRRRNRKQDQGKQW